MNISDVMDELSTRLDTLAGLRPHPYIASRIAPPAAVIGWPEPLTYDSTFARGMDQFTLPLYVIVGAIDARTSTKDLAKYLHGSGDHSVKAALDGGEYTSCDTVRVASATVEAITVGDVDYLGAVFQVEITGSGS